MKAIDLLEKIRNSSLAVFRLGDISRILGKSREYASVYFYRLKKKGYIEEIEKGKYALKDSNIYSVASNIISPSYISFLSALSYYKITTQIPNKITVVSARSKKTIRFRGYDIEFVKFDAKKIFAIKKDFSENKPIFVGKIEKVIVDSLYLPAYCPTDETANAIDKINIGEITASAIKMDSIVLLKRLGFLLENKGYDIFEQVKSRLNTRYDLLNPFAPPDGIRNKKWRLLVNE